MIALGRASILALSGATLALAAASPAQAETLRDAYLEQLQIQQEAVQSLAASMGWLFVEHTTNEAAELGASALHVPLSQIGLTI